MEGVVTAKVLFLAVPEQERKLGFHVFTQATAAPADVPRLQQVRTCIMPGTAGLQTTRAAAPQISANKAILFGLASAIFSNTTYGSSNKQKDQQKLCRHCYFEQILFPFRLDLHYENFLRFNPLLHKVYGAATAS